MDGFLHCPTHCLIHCLTHCLVHCTVLLTVLLTIFHTAMSYTLSYSLSYSLSHILSIIYLFVDCWCLKYHTISDFYNISQMFSYCHCNIFFLRHLVYVIPVFSYYWCLSSICPVAVYQKFTGILLIFAINASYFLGQ